MRQIDEPRRDKRVGYQNDQKESHAGENAADQPLHATHHQT
jgi:hypothetical protein